jgi:GT2 family glycosyltransferase
MNTAVLIPAYKAPEKLEKCLRAVDAQTIEVETLLHDNSEVNIGFTRACNELLMMAYRRGLTYAVILNQDCYLKPDAIEKMVEFMDSHPKCFLGSIKQLSDQNEDLIIHGGTLEAFPYGKHIGGFVSKGNCNVNKRMPWANGACMIVRLSAIPDVGLMDPNYFLLCSDSDWSFTARARGFDIWYIADAVCVHEQGVSSGEATSSLSKAMVRDVTYFRTKWIGSDLFKELSMEVFD